MINRISSTLTFLQFLITNKNSLNLTDLNIHAENFYKDLFGLVFGTNLENTNAHKKNAAHIDLINKHRKVAYQVTAQNDSTKLKESIDGFLSDKEFEDFSLKIILISKDAKDYRSDFTFDGKYKFDHTKDIIDVPRLLIEISNKSIDEISKIADFLEKEVNIPRSKCESNEVETIMKLLEYLSNDANYKKIDKDYECDPNQKINNRFREHATEFKDEYMRLYPIYLNSITESRNMFGLDGVRAEKISSFLIYISNRHLAEASNNPILALDTLTDFFEDKVNLNAIKADVSAIRFYLLNEVIGCNIFSEDRR
ncbi:hypothetical protein EHQ43_18560 [Leptospira bouyouniensis]|uniref:SMEK domain-containing protein n=2 Tax=Leptospira bouyouniensis TaxID=2484911 RepID=A0A7I0HMC2_9LEPT|nr:hypothetical protein EHQ43_18560 [Leptospira bouyouniensis]